MSLTKYILRTIRHYLKLNFTIVLGIALSTAILVGALIIGDSVRYSLQQITVQRLGKTSQVITAGERLFGQQLAEKMAAKTHAQVAPVLRANGFGVINGGELRINQLAVWGIDKAFGEFSVQPELFDLKGNEVAINENLASLAHLKVGDQLLLRLNKLNTFPANTPFVSEKEATVSFQVTIAKILKTDELGNFNLKNIQSAPRNVFLNLDELNKQMGLQEKANVLLFAGLEPNIDLPKALQESWSLADLNLTIRENQSLNYTELISDRVFVEPAVEQFVTKDLPGSKSIFSYFVNDFTVGDKQTPYSFVSTDENLSGNQMAVSEWLANDLKAKVGDAVKVSYFEVGPLRRLVQKDTTFVISSIFRMEGAKADPQLAPVIPGLSDAGNCRDWKTGVPVDLKKIRPNDEEYWNKHKGTPKAYISLETAQKLWKNRFGEATAIRVEGSKKAEMESALLAGLVPAQVGFELTNVKSDGMAAATGGTDFGGLFIGLSFFVLFAAVLLAFLLFKLSLNFRRQEIGTLTALGFSLKQLRKIYLAEASLLIVFGIVLGLPFAIFYNNLILKAVNTIWVDIVRTSIVNISIQPMSLLIGGLSIAVISVVAVWLILNRFLKNEVIALQRKSKSEKHKTGKWSLRLGLSLILLSLAILFGMGFRSGEINPDMFFTAGFGFLPGLILLFDYALQRLAIQEKAMNFSVKNLLMKRIAGERRRNVMIVSFLSVGVFMVVSTGLYRKDLTAHADLPSSGTGGYDYFVETTMPVLFDVNGAQGREDLNLPDSAQVVQFQVQQGDDAS
ncbi:MAG TPA: ABC transporter permease, partial [Prolixibacteraceae bacterium]|nr:ABC transporter permease [Prolixibacteraceae bacterium]